MDMDTGSFCALDTPGLLCVRRQVSSYYRGKFRDLDQDPDPMHCLCSQSCQDHRVPAVRVGGLGEGGIGAGRAGSGQACGFRFRIGFKRAGDWYL